jgi:hypothetical protein
MTNERKKKKRERERERLGKKNGHAFHVDLLFGVDV